MIDKDLITRKINLINRDLIRLEQFRDFTIDEMAKDFIKYGALKNILMEIIGRALDINQHIIAQKTDLKQRTPLDYAETFLYLGKIKVLPLEFAQEIAKSAGFRNAIVHAYNNLDENIVYQTVGQAIDQYTKYCDYILKFLDELE